MKLFGKIVTSICLLSIFFVGFNCIADNKVRNFDLKNDFNGLQLNCSAHVIVKTGKENSLQIECSDPKAFDRVKVQVKDQVLVITAGRKGTKRWSFVGGSFEQSGIKILINVKKLNKIVSTGDAKIEVDGNIQEDTFSVTNIGSATITLPNVVCKKFTAKILGTGNLYISTLKANNSFSLLASGSSLFNVKEIETLEADITLTGSSTANIRNSQIDEMNVTTAGSGTLSLEGSGKKVKFTADGSGRIYAGLFKCDNAVLKAMGTSNLELYVNDSISVDVYGGSIVNIDGSPKDVKRNVYGSGSTIMESSIGS